MSPAARAPEVRRHHDADALVSACAAALLRRLETAQARGEVPQVGLTGGTIATALYRELAQQAASAAVDWSRIVFWWGDERFVPADSPERNAGLARAALLDQVPVDPANVHEIAASDQVTTAEDAASAYCAAMHEHGTGCFEVLLLGLGPDGHIASLFPGHAGLAARGAVAVAVHDSPKPPPDRVTLTFEAMQRCRAVWFIVSGASKAEAVARALASAGSVEETPARGVRGEETVWWLDASAASAL